MTSPVWIDADAAIELGELLEVIDAWLTHCDAAAAWERFMGAAYGCDEFQRDLLRFVSLLGGEPQNAVDERAEP
jgi:hypothetical protein